MLISKKAMEIKIRAQEKVLFVPQNCDNHGVQSQGMYSAKPHPSGKGELLNFVRFEWNQAGAEFGAEIVKVLAGHHRQEAKQHERCLKDTAAGAFVKRRAARDHPHFA